MSIPVEGSYRSLIAETLLQVRRRQAQVKGLAEELEAIVQAAAGLQKVDLKEFVLDVDTLEFTERPKPPQPELVPSVDGVVRVEDVVTGDKTEDGVVVSEFSSQ